MLNFPVGNGCRYARPGRLENSAEVGGWDAADRLVIADARCQLIRPPSRIAVQPGSPRKKRPLHRNVQHHRTHKNQWESDPVIGDLLVYASHIHHRIANVMEQIERVR